MRIDFKISSLVVGTVVVGTAILSWLGYSAARTEYLAGVDRQLTAAAAALPGVIGEDYLDRAMGNENVSVEEYDSLVHTLSDLADRSAVFYLYAFRQDDDRVIHLATSASPAERAAADWPKFRAPYEEPPIELRSTLADGKIRFAEYSDEFGSFRSTFVRHADAQGGSYVVGVDVALDDLQSNLVALIWRHLLSGGLVAAVTGLLGLLLARQISRPIQSLADSLRDVATERGDLTHEMDERRGDELGELAHWFNAFIKQLRDIRHTVANTTLNAGSATARIATSAREQAQTVRAFQASTAQAASAVTEIAATSRTLAGIVRDVDNLAQRTNQRANAGRGRLNELDALLAEMTGATAATSDRIHAIQSNADKIDLATTTMIKIADQTNILSVNAAIEAENAGDSGHGFRAVSREIRRVAEQTAKATLEIESIVRGIHESVSLGVTDVNRFREQMKVGLDAVRQLTGGLGAIIGDVESLGASFGDVRQMATEQSASAEDIHDSIVRLDIGAREIADSSATFAQVTSQLQEVTEELKAHVSSISIGQDPQRPSAHGPK